MLVFVTVGSTRFDSLVQAVLSLPVLSSLRLRGYTELVVQCGNSAFELASSISQGENLIVEREGITVELWKFKPSLDKEYERADLVISHAGSGTILDVLRLGKPLIVVPNPTLLDNHQEELSSLPLHRFRSTIVTAISRKPSKPLIHPPSYHFRHLTVVDLRDCWTSTWDSFELNNFVFEYSIEVATKTSVLILHPRSPRKSMAPKTVATTVVDEDPQEYEDKNVHAIYDEIASHFSSTRYKPWPIISKFISSIETGWVGLDSGTGNGKYLPLPLERPMDIFTIGLDRSINLLRIARHAGESGTMREVVWGDVLGHGWRSGIFDYAISIATIHHLATHERRTLAVKRLLEVVSPKHGRVLIYVWAIEQDEQSKRKIPTGDESDTHLGKDVVVPWVLTKQGGSEGNGGESGQQQVFNRYYHMFAKGELPALVHDAAKLLGIHVGMPSPAGTSPSVTRGVHIVQDGWERSNYYVELKCWEIHR
ncbi:tRNA (carboxymethyluridine(34)-5-O)-methyltransferase [Hypsizygus marmoreus]|uniref:UDP-N-acetylglucosamine transferase subunit ALG13 n=1 Tax=Hypsizygus marmoreus TaxID=39966 RepID=A0A369JUZ8_HYPMA|nr:tRNA (carboxymethyluridine(34)-5-O)-methyltransferase [Hypsizygus marmoreus]